jgi:hypothetical protein
MKGYVALTSVLSIVPLLLLTGISSLYKNISMLSVGRMNYDSQILKSHTETCIEETVYRIKRNPLLTGEISLSGVGWTCIVNITEKEGYTNVKTLRITTSDLNGVKSTIKKELDTNPSPFVISNTE